MSAPTVERTRTTTRPTTRRAGRDGTSAETPRDAGGAVGRAYARRAGRKQRIGTEPTEASAGRSQFVLLIMVLLGVGLVTSLWLSTTAAADSYRLDAARSATRDLSERSESLRREIATTQSAPALAQAAAGLGMVPATDVARLVAAPNGEVTVVGTPKAAVATAPPAPLAPPLPTVTAPGVAPVVAQPSAPAAPQTAPAAPAQQAAAQPGVVPAPEQDSEQAVQTQAELEQAAQQPSAAQQTQQQIQQQAAARPPRGTQQQTAQQQTAQQPRGTEQQPAQQTQRGIQPGIAGVPMVVNGGTGH
ncbi:hypothetical protein [Pseudonocardia spinosispora]|uniref:hypothetical protein n=1 Tax=Pseudonocardia spinosispora TaxID=103441 RepID=UPI0003FFB135|nr:hypothetical protein [Pseudonocardia spinosispora]